RERGAVAQLDMTRAPLGSELRGTRRERMLRCRGVRENAAVRDERQRQEVAPEQEAGLLDERQHADDGAARVACGQVGRPETEGLGADRDGRAAMIRRAGGMTLDVRVP